VEATGSASFQTPLPYWSPKRATGRVSFCASASCPPSRSTLDQSWHGEPGPGYRAGANKASMETDPEELQTLRLLSIMARGIIGGVGCDDKRAPIRVGGRGCYTWERPTLPCIAAVVSEGSREMFLNLRAFGVVQLCSSKPKYPKRTYTFLQG